MCSESAVFFSHIQYRSPYTVIAAATAAKELLFCILCAARKNQKMRIRISYAPHLPFRSVTVRLCGIHTHAHDNYLFDAKLIHRDGKIIIIYYFELVWLADKSELFIFFIGQVVAEYVFTYTHAHTARTHTHMQTQPKS